MLDLLGYYCFEIKPYILLVEVKKRCLVWRTCLSDSCMLDLLGVSKGYIGFPYLGFLRDRGLY
jgi:hypothetical protein